MLGLKTTLGVNIANADGPPMQSRSEQVHINWIDYPSGPSVEVFKYDARVFVVFYYFNRIYCL